MATRGMRGSALLHEEDFDERRGLWSSLTRTPENRRRLIAVAVTIGVLILLGITLGISLGMNTKKDHSLPKDPAERARALQSRYPLIDGHNDLPWMMRKLVKDRIGQIDLTTNQPELQTDIPRLRKGVVGGQFWSVYVPCSMQGKQAVRATLEQIDVVYRLCDAYPEVFQLSFTADNVQAAFDKGRVASLMGMEGAHAIDSSLGALRMFYNMGVRYMTLTHACNTPEFGSCADVPINEKGITDFGEIIVKEMNRLGMLVDISHVAHSTMRTVLQIAKAPVIFSHSSVYSLCSNLRNVPDDVLDLLPDNGGVVMINFYNLFVGCTNKTDVVRLSQVADHIDYIRKRIGADYIGLGADYDGVGGEDFLPEGLKDVSTYPNLMAELIRRGYSDEEVIKIMGGNVLRVLRKAEEVARKLQEEIPPQDEVKWDL